MFDQRLIELEKVHSNDNGADMFTKYVSSIVVMDARRNEVQQGETYRGTLQRNSRHIKNEVNYYEIKKIDGV